MDDFALQDYLQVEAAGFLLVFMRVLGLFLFAPLYSSRLLPVSIRVHLAIAIAYGVVGLTQPPASAPTDVLDLAGRMAAELVVGLILGSFVQFVFAALQLAGQTTGLQLGLALANVVNPQFDEQISTTAVVYATVASLIFLATGLDRELFRALFETFDVVPPGAVVLDASSIEVVFRVLQQSMIFAVRVAAPVTIAMLLAEIAMGFVGKTVPQLNILSVGFSVRIVLGLVVTMAGLSEVGRGFLDYAGQAVLDAVDALARLAPDFTPDGNP